VSSRKIAVLGAGKAGEALIAGLLSSGWREPPEIAATARHAERLADLSERHGIETTLSNVDAAAGAGIVVIAVKPQDIESLLADVGSTLTNDQTVITIAAAIPTRLIEGRLGEGEIRAGDRRYALDPRRCFGVQDWGRGIWPYRSCWNWGVATGWAGDALLGVNFGARWTTGTGSNENGILCNGRLHKIMEDLRWEYDPLTWRKPWRVVAEHSGAVDLVLEPVVAHTPRVNLGVLATGGVCAFGYWHGRVRVEGRDIAVDRLLGWAEEFAHRW